MLFRAVTQNVSDSGLHRAERSVLRNEELKELKPDVVITQEADHEDMQQMAEFLGTDYKVHYASSYKRNSLSGLAITSVYPLIENKLVEFWGIKNGVQQTSFDIGEKQPLTVINVHHELFNEFAKLRKARKIGQTSPCGPLIVAGDHNSPSQFPSIRHLERTMTSVFKHIHGKEPEKTYPTSFADELVEHQQVGLAENLVLSSLKRLSRILGRNEQDRLGFTIDKFHVRNIKVINAQVYGDSRYLSSLPSSDHYGLLADLEV